MRRAIQAGLFLSTLFFLVFGIQLYRRHWEWLNTRHLDTLSMFLLGSFGLAVLLTPVILRRVPHDTSETEFIKVYVITFSQVFGILAGITLVLILFGLLIELVGKSPLIMLPLLLLLLPLALISIDMFKGKIKKSLRNLLIGYSYYSFETLYLLIAQFLLIPFLFFLGPLGIGMILVSILDFVFRIVPGLEAAPTHVLCYWTGIGHPWCTPYLIILFLLYAITAYVAVRYGNQIMNLLASGYRLGKAKLGSAIKMEGIS